VLVSLTAAMTALAQPAAAPQQYPDTQGYSQRGTAATYPPTPVATQQVPGQQGSAAGPQTAAPQQPAAQAPAIPQVPPGFQLNALQEAALNQLLDAWQQESSKVVTFSCPFDRLEYVAAFGPVISGQLAPLNRNKGELTFSKPDKGSFEITEINTWKVQPAPADRPQAAQQGDWVKQPDAIGEHWVCDGKSVYEYRANQKLVIERPLPPQLAGQNIIDGPLPFLFGAEAGKLKQRYWMRMDDRNQDPNQAWINALPKFQQQAADFRQVDVILDRNRLLPAAMQVTLPNGDRHVYVFHIEKANVNGVLSRIQNALFQKPPTPFGWKHVVENAPLAEAVPVQSQPTR
jgi:TIGR03009 family protein